MKYPNGEFWVPAIFTVQITACNHALQMDVEEIQTNATSQKSKKLAGSLNNLKHVYHAKSVGPCCLQGG